MAFDAGLFSRANRRARDAVGRGRVHSSQIKIKPAAHKVSPGFGLIDSPFVEGETGGNLKPYSDLDLCLRGAAPVPGAILSKLNAAFEDRLLIPLRRAKAADHIPSKLGR